MEEEGDYIYLSLQCHHQNDSFIKTGSGESNFNVSLIVRDSHKTRYTDRNISKEKRTEAELNRGPSVHQPDASPLGQASSQNSPDSFLNSTAPE